MNRKNFIENPKNTKVRAYLLLGKLPNLYRSVCWKLKSEDYKLNSKLSILAYLSYLKEKYGFEDINLTLMVPHSIFLNKQNNIEISSKFLKDLNYLEKLVRNLFYDIAKEILNFDLKIEVQILPSISSYAFHNEIYTYDYSFFDRILFNYILFLHNFEKDLLSHKNLKIILDVSVGLNIFITEILEAFYSLCVYKSIYEDYFKFFKKNRNIELYLLSTDPVLDSSPDKEKRIDVYKISKKFFFEAPLKIDDINKIKNIFSALGLEEYKKDIENLTKVSLFLFNIIKYNLPLGITIFNNQQIVNLNKNFKKTYSNIIESFKDVICKLSFKEENQNNISISKPYDYKDSKSLFNYIKNLTFLLNLGKLLWKILLSFEEFDKYFEKSSNSNLKLKIYRQSIDNKNLINHPYFKHILKIYENFNLKLNKVFLEKDLKYKNCRNNNSDNSIICRLKKCIKNNSIMDNNNSEEISERNLLAHSGFESNSICLEKHKNYCLVYYCNKKMEEIKNIILNLNRDRNK